jgi:ubiquinone/menaquinone biosynthesis C-methylase UbiE
MNTIVTEGMATGLPVITTNHSGLPEQVLDGKSGAVVREGDYEALAEKILFLIEHPELWPEFGRIGRNHVATNYNSKMLMDSQIECYLQLLRHGQRTHIEGEETIRRIWDGVWKNDEVSPVDIIMSRFTAEAFAKLGRFVTSEDEQILEVGCGTGRFCALIAQRYPQSSVNGIDISLDALKIGTRLKNTLRCGNVSFAQGSVFRLPFADNQFDLVMSEGLVSQFSPDNVASCDDAIRELVRVTKRRGKLVIAVPNWYCAPHTVFKWLLKRQRLPYEYGYEKSFSRRELLKIFQKFGLRQIQVEGFYSGYGFHRLAWRLHHRLGIWSHLFKIAGRLVDKIDNDRISRWFGFNLVIKGTKWPSADARSS